MVDISGNSGCLLLFPVLMLWWIEINCRWWRRFYTDWFTGDKKNIFLWVSQNRDVHRQLWYSTWPPALFLSHSHFLFFSPISTSLCSSLSSPRALSRAVMGLDRESDVVHIETRIAKGRECCTPVHRNSETHGDPTASHLERGHGEDETRSVVQIGPWSLVKQNRCLLTKTESFSGLMDVSSL